MSDWITSTLGQLLAENGGSIKTGPFGTVLKAHEYSASGVPLISVGEIGYGTIRIHEKTPRVSPQVTSRLPEYILRVGDIIFARKGAVDRSARIRSEQDGWFLGSDGIRLRLPDAADSKFLAYQLQSERSRSWILQHATGTTMASLNQGVIERIPIVLPPVEVQQAIAHILGTLDAKIELNRRMNETLDAMSRALFRSWFVDFDPVRAKAAGRTLHGMDASTAALFPGEFVNSALGPIPKGWQAAPVYDVATYVNGAAYKAFQPNHERRGLPIIKIAELKAGVTEQTKFSDVQMPEKYRLRTGDILFSWSGNPDTSIDTFVWTHGPAWLNQHIFRVVPRTAEQRTFVLATLKYLRPVFAEIARNKQTTGLGHVTVGDLQRLSVAMPNAEVVAAWERVAAQIFDTAFSKEQESITLARSRDELLPRLLSGEISVARAEREVGALA